MQDRAPLLIVGANKDNTVPASLAKKQFEKYEKHEAYDAQTDYIEFAGRPHFMMITKGWEEIADEIDHWIKNPSQRPRDTRLVHQGVSDG